MWIRYGEETWEVKSKQRLIATYRDKMQFIQKQLKEKSQIDKIAVNRKENREEQAWEAVFFVY